MPLIPDDKVDEIREATDIVALVGEHVQLRRAGTNFVGLCPFHNERTPSFNVNPGKQIFKCFGCDEKGDAFSFLMKIENKTFMEAARELARRKSIELPERERSPEELRAESEREKHVKVNELAADFFRATLAGPGGEAARAYLEKRGIDEATQQTFRLGYAPDAWDALALHLVERKVPPAYALATGLIGTRERGGGHYDKFRGRLMCPVFNMHGEIVAFSGRIIDPNAPKDVAKYINSPESPVYTKGRLLYGIHQARDGFAKKRRAILVEGNFDVISMYRAGFHETVCPLGTALTTEQVDLLRRRVEKVVLMLDADPAGRKATLRSAEILIKAGVPVYVVTLDSGDDPDSFVRRAGAEGVARRVDAAVRAVKHFVDNLPHLGDLDPVEAVEHARGVVFLIQAIPDRTAAEMAAHQVQAATGVPYAKVLQWVETARAAEQKARPEVTRPAPNGTSPNASGLRQPKYGPEHKLVALIADHPSLRRQIGLLGLDTLVRDPEVKIALAVAAEAPDDSARDRRIGSLMLDAAPTLAPLILGGYFATVESPEQAITEAAGVLRTPALRAQLADAQSRLKQAERAGDPNVSALAREVLELKTKLNILLADLPPGGQI